MGAAVVAAKRAGIRTEESREKYHVTFICTTVFMRRREENLRASKRRKALPLWLLVTACMSIICLPALKPDEASGSLYIGNTLTHINIHVWHKDTRRRHRRHPQERWVLSVYFCHSFLFQFFFHKIVFGSFPSGFFSVIPHSSACNMLFSLFVHLGGCYRVKRENAWHAMALSVEECIFHIILKKLPNPLGDLFSIL